RCAQVAEERWGLYREAVGLDCFGIPRIVHAPEGDLVRAISRDHEGHASVRLLASAVERVVRRCHAAGGVASGEGDTYRSRGRPRNFDAGDGRSRVIVEGRRQSTGFDVAGLVDGEGVDGVRAVEGKGRICEGQTPGR